MRGTGFERYSTEELYEYLNDDVKKAFDYADEPNTINAIADTIGAIVTELHARGER